MKQKGFISIVVPIVVVALVGVLAIGSIIIDKNKLTPRQTFHREMANLLDRQQSGNLGATIPVVIAGKETSLASKITSSDTSMTLVNGTDRAGNSLSGYICFTLDVNESSEEYVCGTTSATAVSSMIRGVDPVDGDLEVSALKKSHRRGASVIISNYPSIGVISRILNGDETLPNKIRYATDLTFTDDKELIAKKYADDLAIAGAPDSSFSVKGLVEMATTSELIAGSSTGDTTAPLVAPNSFFNTTSTATNIVPVSGTDGKLSQGFLDLTEAFTFEGDVVATSTSLTMATSTTENVFSLIPAGSIMAFATSTAPNGWLNADGSSFATSTYSNLFSVIGYTYGGSGANFNVPNIAGRNILGFGSSTVEIDTMGESGGELEHTQTEAELVAHTHNYPDSNNNANDSSVNGIQNPQTVSGTLASSSTGGGNAFNVADPFIVLNYIIKY